MKIITNIIDGLHPETRAMLQAFYSRSWMGIEERVADLGNSEEKIKENLKKYYIGYGHKSVADLASITIFFEGVSMLAAKAIQDNPLYNGQESSTRYIDYSTQEFISPYENNDEFYEFWANRFRSFYQKALQPTIDHIKSRYPDDGSKFYEKTVKAKAFDVLRGFLPAGFATNVAWTGSLRNIGEHLRKLLNHPLIEVRDIAGRAYEKLEKDYPNSFRPLRDEDYFKNDYFYIKVAESTNTFECNEKNEFEYDKNNPFFKVLRINSDHFLDFASWRDLQRHRNMVSFMPLLTTDLGFESFYVSELPDSLVPEILALLDELKVSLSLYEDSDTNKQYSIPMGFLCNVMLSFDAHQAVYLATLRSGKTVHPTLRVWAQNLGRFLEKHLDIKAKVDYDDVSWTLKRGTQDIIKND